MTKRVLPLLALGLVLGAAALPAQILSYDDGTAENSIGFPNGGSLAYLNSFVTATPGTTQVAGVQIAFGAPVGGAAIRGGEGLPITVYLWSDPNNDGSPSDAQVIASATGTIINANTNTFLSFAFASPVMVNTNNFFVGFLVNTGADQFPGAIDQGAPTFANRSFLAGTTTGTLNPNALGASQFFGTVESFGFPGNWLIRANVAAVPEPATVIGGALAVGTLGLHVVRRRRRGLAVA